MAATSSGKLDSLVSIAKTLPGVSSKKGSPCLAQKFAYERCLAQQGKAAL